MLTSASSVVSLGSVVELKGGRPGVIVRILRHSPSRGYVADLKTGRMRPIGLQRLVRGRFVSMVKIIFKPPEGFIHPFSIYATNDVCQTKQRRVFVAQHLTKNERYRHPRYGEFWQVSAIERLIKVFLDQRNTKDKEKDENGKRRRESRQSPHCIACGQVHQRSSKAAQRCLSCQWENRTPGKTCFCRYCGAEFPREVGSHETTCANHRKQTAA